MSAYNQKFYCCFRLFGKLKLSLDSVFEMAELKIQVRLAIFHFVLSLLLNFTLVFNYQASKNNNFHINILMFVLLHFYSHGI